MNVQIKTKVKGYYKDILARFDRQLFEALAPPFPKMEIVEFTGSKKGDKVHIRFLGPIQIEWISHITEHGEDAEAAWFVDEGVQLPPGLSYWRHRHIVRRLSDTHSEIIDDMTFKGPNDLITACLYPAVYLGFSPRKKIYQRYFGV